MNDYFAQNVIDFILGRVDESAFIDFEADMKAQDYAIDLRKVRQNAIETCRSICIENEGEDLVAGWTMSCPRDAGSLRSLPFEECVLLLTDQALYFCRMDWTTEKVASFERIGLECIDAVARGVYITSTLAKREMDEKKNVGFVIKYETPGGELVRRNTRSLSIVEDAETLKAQAREGNALRTSGAGEKILAFKALPPRSSFTGMQGGEPSEVEVVKMVTDQIVGVVNKTRVGEGVEKVEVTEKDIIGVHDARKSTGYLEQLGYSLKRLVWT